MFVGVRRDGFSRGVDHGHRSSRTMEAKGGLDSIKEAGQLTGF